MVNVNAIYRVGLFGNITRTNTLLVIGMLTETHASEIARVLGVSLSQVQKAVVSLERAGIVVGVYVGNARRLQLNPRYPFKDELAELLLKMGAADKALLDRLGEIRRRPRRAGKQI